MILSITFIPSTAVRVILGLPFLLFFPGHTLAAALLVAKEGMDIIQRIALSCGMSIAVTTLIGFCLNYTTWGIRLEPFLYCTTAFIFVTSFIALIRRIRILKTNKSIVEFKLNFPGWGGSSFNKFLSIMLVAAIFGALGTLTYAIAEPKIGGRFTDFYILGINGQADSYPTEYVMSNNQIVQVIYGNGLVDAVNGYGTVILGIVDQEQQTAVYSVKITINGTPVNIEFNGTITDVLGPIELRQGEKWEQKIGITPRQTGTNQKVELLLFNGNKTTAEDSVHFWINVK